MPRARSGQLFDIGGQWIARISERGNYYRHWTERGTGITRRASLGTADLEDAKRRLAEIVVRGAPKTSSSLLAAVLLEYFENRTDNLPSRKQSRNAGRIVLQFWGNSIRVNQLTEAKQKEFAQWSVSRGFALSYVARNLSVVKAALAFVGIVPASPLWAAESKLRERWNIATRDSQRAYIPTDAELAAFFRCDMPRGLKRWAVIALLTAGRPSACVELNPAARQKATGLLNLNPAGRAQNRKYRALVREPRCLSVFLNQWERDGLNGASYCGYTTIEGVNSALDRVRERNPHLPPLSTYSFRHKPASVLRLARVPEDQIALQLGHRRRDLRMTAGYGEFDPGYLRDAARALDGWFLRLRRMVSAVPTPQKVRRAA